MDVQGADGLEGDPRPSRFECSRAHVVGTADHGGGKEERVFKRDPADLRAEPLLVSRRIDLQLRFHLFLQPQYEPADRDLLWSDAGLFAGRRAVSAGNFDRQTRCSLLFIVKPDAAQKTCGIQPAAGAGAGGVMAKNTPQHVGAIQCFCKHFRASSQFDDNFDDNINLSMGWGSKYVQVSSVVSGHSLTSLSCFFVKYQFAARPPSPFSRTVPQRRSRTKCRSMHCASAFALLPDKASKTEQGKNADHYCALLPSPGRLIAKEIRKDRTIAASRSRRAPWA